MKRFINGRRLLGLFLALSILFSHSAPALALEPGIEGFYSTNNILMFDENATECAVAGAGQGGASGEPLPSAVPDPWRSLIESVAATYPTADRRLVAATLWAENRGWPVYKTSGWGVSGASAQGPWQFIPSTWASMGTDGDGDGRKDPDNPKDAVHAAFKHQIGSSGLPVLFQATGNADVDFSSKPFYRNDKAKNSLMTFMAKYNGRGAPDGVLLSNFPRNQNSDYVRMGYWLIATNFEKGWLPEANKFVDAKTTGKLFGSGSSAGPGAPGSPAQSCAAGGLGNVDADGYAFPLVGPKDKIENGYTWPCQGFCHHDNTAAFDLTHEKNDSSEGLAVYAIRDGTIGSWTDSYAGVQGCNAFQLEASDGYKYWYGHLSKAVASKKTVKAGEQIAVIGRRACTGNGSYPHLHIDRGYPKGYVGGIDAHRDKEFIPLMNKLYAEMK